MNKKGKIVVGISLGDINGVGIEVILKTFEDKRMLDFCTPLLFGSSKVISAHKKILNIETHIHEIKSIEQIRGGQINLLTVWNEEVKLEIGNGTKIGGQYAFKSLNEATKSLKKDEIDILITAPINKDTIQSEEFNFSGHTEFLERNLEGESLMILMNDFLRIGLITGHIPISKIAETITPELIESKVKILNNSLKQDFNINKPKIAVLGLNPHSGDNGVIGEEENNFIKPTLNSIHEKGIFVYGPYAADGFFGSEAYKQFDGVLAMYHDQGLAPFKALTFGNGVNFTAGLSHIRISPDHGTAFDIAGKGKANPDSFKEAVFTGIKIFKNRNEYKELTQNVLRPKKR
ncbi:MAG: 4-hydroxythreonine-4-phosphate dehydrogenase PdxA [Flavobacteriaceae bacterium]